MALQTRKKSDDPQDSPGTADLAQALEADWKERERILADSPILAFLAEHDRAETPDEHTVCGVAHVRVKLGDLRALVAALK